MKAKCAVSFEFPTRPPVTWRGDVEGAALHTVVHRAAALAAKTLKPREWTSMTVWILEREK
jgi:hypothetical protein